MGRKENLANARNIFSEIMQKISNDKEEWKEFLRFVWLVNENVSNF